MANAKPDAAIVVAKKRRNRTQAIVSSVAAAGFDPHPRRWKVQFIMQHDDMIEWQFEKACSIADGSSAFVHERPGAQKQRTFTCDQAFARIALKTGSPRGEPVATMNGVERHEPDIVPVALISGTRISEARDQAHQPLRQAAAAGVAAVAERSTCGGAIEATVKLSFSTVTTPSGILRSPR